MLILNKSFVHFYLDPSSSCVFHVCTRNTFLAPLLSTSIARNVFQITHSYFSSPVTCPTTLKQFHSPFPRDVVFGSVGKTFQHKWHGNGYAHPHTNTETQQALHWARLAAKYDSNSITILVMLDKNWYHNPNPHNGPFLDSHVITHFKADTIIYKEPTIPP